MARQKKTTPKQAKHDDIGDAFPNDWIEALILFVAGVGVFGGVIALVYLAEKAGAL